MKIKLSFKYIFAFLCLTSILGISHELMHHVAGSIICKCIGYKTFNMFELCDGCESSIIWIATLVGPLFFNYIPMWIGFFLLRSQDAGKKLFGFTLIFAALPILRIVFSILGANDEPWIVRSLYGDSSIAYNMMVMIVLLLTLPPLIKALITIKNKFKLIWFLGFFLLPAVFVYFFVGVLLEDLIVVHHFLDQPLLGMPILVLLVEVLSYMGYHFYKEELFTSLSID